MLVISQVVLCTVDRVISCLLLDSAAVVIVNMVYGIR